MKTTRTDTGTARTEPSSTAPQNCGVLPDALIRAATLTPGSEPIPSPMAVNPRLDGMPLVGLRKKFFFALLAVGLAPVIALTSVTISMSSFDELSTGALTALVTVILLTSGVAWIIAERITRPIDECAHDLAVTSRILRIKTEQLAGLVTDLSKRCEKIRSEKAKQEIRRWN